ncbi:hypothetical protein [Bifidobacterium sp. ESL0764]|nr:hypothetical protein [Bifidobacterium sp. ESL0764]WEV66410.1 hypothetical protein OZX71_03455 [Bifidobacterium sp. ESL0764]
MNRKKNKKVMAFILACQIAIIALVCGGLLLRDSPLAEVEYSLSRIWPVVDQKVHLPQSQLDKGKVVTLAMRSSLPPVERGNFALDAGGWYMKGFKYVVDIGIAEAVPLNERDRNGTVKQESWNDGQDDAKAHVAMSKSADDKDNDGLAIGETKDFPDDGCSLTLIGLKGYAPVPQPGNMVGGNNDGYATVLVTPYQNGPVVKKSAQEPEDDSGKGTTRTVKVGSITHIDKLNVFAPYTLDHDKQGYSAIFCVQDYASRGSYQRCMPNKYTRLRLGETKTYHTSTGSSDVDNVEWSLTLQALTQSDGLQAFTIQVKRQ